MATVDSLENEIKELRKTMNSLSPNLPLYKNCEARLVALKKLLEFTRANPPKPQPKGLLDFDDNYVPVFKPQRTRYQSKDNFEELQNIDQLQLENND